MDSEGYDVVEFILRLAEVEMGKQREKTTEMAEQLSADRAAMEAKENEVSMLMAEKDEMLAVTMTVDKLLADFLEADDNKNFDAQRALENEIVALMNRDADSSTGGSGDGVNGENIGYLENGDSE
ncbi:hypothetical protein HRI_001577900 [Hibiscus trionum]|uniref:Uncharacterized protein n=1 Tax=Hibiscus trionum TaxID=183268 RepID=A0A9W7LWY7_HIBTR|nr:hypothetical protein HRI_001577900 [Hibiscus trionum]